MPMSAADRAVDVILRRIGDRLALPDLAVVAGLPEDLHREDAVDSFERPVHGGAIFHLALHDLGALGETYCDG
jgi:hypothetical protein